MKYIPLGSRHKMPIYNLQHQLLLLSKHSTKIIIALTLVRLIAYKYVISPFKGLMLGLECLITLLIFIKSLSNAPNKTSSTVNELALNSTETRELKTEVQSENNDTLYKGHNYLVNAEIRKQLGFYKEQNEQQLANLNSIKEENKELSKVVTQLLEEANTLKTKKQKSNDERKLLRSEVDYYKNKASKLKEKNVHLSTDNKQLESKIHSLVEQNRLLQKALASNRETNGAQLKSMNSLYKKVHLLEEQLQLKDSERAYHNYLDIKEKELKHKDEIIESLSKTKESLIKELEYKMDDYLQLINKLMELQSLNDNQKEELSKLEFKIDRLQNDNERIRKERAQSKNQSKDFNEQLHSLQDELHHYLMINEELSNKTQNIENELELLKQSNQELKEKEKSYNNLKIRFNSQKQTIMMMADQTQNLKEQNKSLEMEIASLKTTAQKPISDESKKDKTLHIRESILYAKLVKENESLKKSFNRINDANNEYILKLSETQLSLKIKESQIFASKKETSQSKDALVKAQGFVDSFKEEFQTLVSILQALIPQYIGQKEMLTRFSHSISFEEKNITILKALKEKNLKFKRILKQVIEENFVIRNELEMRTEEIRSLKGQLQLKEEFISVLSYSNEAENSENFEHPLNNGVTGNLKALSPTSQFINEFQTKDIFINDKHIGTTSDISLISGMTKMFDLDFKASDTSSLMTQPSPVLDNYSTSLPSSSDSPIKIQLDDLVLSSKDEKFTNHIDSLFHNHNESLNLAASEPMAEQLSKEYALETQISKFLHPKTSSKVGVNLDFNTLCKELTNFNAKVSKEAKAVKEACSFIDAGVAQKSADEHILLSPISAPSSPSSSPSPSPSPSKFKSISTKKKVPVFRDSSADSGPQVLTNNFISSKGHPSLLKASLQAENIFYASPMPAMAVTTPSKKRAHAPVTGLTPKPKNALNFE